MYRLAGRYKNSLLLNFAIHKILMQPGREKEVWRHAPRGTCALPLQPQTCWTFLVWCQSSPPEPVLGP